MIPLSDDNPRLRTPLVTIGLLAAMAAVWVFVQGAGADGQLLSATVCNLGLVPGELTGRAALGTAVPLGNGMACIVDADPINWLTPLTSMFLHGGWLHILGNALFFWIFGDNVEDSMGRMRFLAFYLLCGLIAAAAQVLADPGSPVPIVGASGAISGVMGAYLVFFPRARVRMLFIFIIFFKIFRVPAWIVLLYWFGLQVLAVFMQVAHPRDAAASGVAVMAHVCGFLAGVLLAKPFENRMLVATRGASLR
jgi:membrane associated rhomboid family serine protease